MENLFQKTAAPLLVESTMIENAIFPYKTTTSEANVKAKRQGITKLTYHKEQSLARNSFSFLKILFQYKNLS